MSSEDDAPPARDASERAGDAEALARIEAGGIPLATERRLRALAAGPMFTSGLSVAEFALGHQLGLEPLGQVMGASIHQVGIQYAANVWRGQGASYELDALTHAWDQARRRALDRLVDEARLLGADAVVGVRVHRGEHDWAAECVDYVVNGTAVRWGGTPAGWPVLTDLSVQDYWKLIYAGYTPAGLVAATCVYFVSPSSSANWTRAVTVASNQELGDYTRGFSAARETALRYLFSQADAVRATGIVGVQIDHHARMTRVGAEDNQQSGLEITFHALGTAIREAADEPQYPPEATLRMGAKR